MNTALFRSPLAPRLQTFGAMRRALGRQAYSDYKILRYLDGYLLGVLRPGQPLTREIVEGWIASMTHLSVGTRVNRLALLRQFCRYLSHFDPRTCLVSRQSVPHRTRHAPYIFTPQQVRTIMARARRIGPPGSLRPMLLSTLIGLLATTGLRIGEALKLTLADVDLTHRVLLIRQTKFNKSRHVPLSASTACALSVFLGQRQAAGFSTIPTAPVFVNPEGQAYSQTRVGELFRAIARTCKLRGPVSARGPRLHDFRHTFAVQRLVTWYRQGAPLAAKLPLLSTYLGHTTLTGTEVYLQATAELLEEAGQRFHRHCALPPLRREAPHAHQHRLAHP
ncbi:MAG: tyrosine-type recombinase/integrase [Nitrospira sp.]|nr:tyrosine-type recombinase/integrase [Nitrospira sp.]